MVATHLENLEKLGNSKVVRENEKKQGKTEVSVIVQSNYH